MQRLAIAAIAAIFVGLLPMAALAGETVIWGGYGGLSAGAMWMNVGELNDYLDPLRVSDFSSTIPMIGLDAYALLGGRVVVGLEGYGFNQTKGGALADASLRGGYGVLYCGYNVVHTDNFRLRPEIGLGGMGTNVQIHNVGWMLASHRLSNDYDEILLTQEGYLGTVALAAEWTPSIMRRDNGRLDLVVSLKTGLRVPLWDEGWEARAISDDDDHDDVDLDMDGPDLPMLAPYVALGIRFGGGITEID